MKSTLIYSHIIGGVIVLLTGIIAMLIQPKGNKLHKRIGLIYYFTMIYVALSSVVSMLLFDFFFFLFPIAIFSFHLVYSGFRATKQAKTNTIAWYDWLVAYGTFLIGFALFGYGVNVIYCENNMPLAILSMVFGLFIALSGFGDVKIYKKLQEQGKMWWWFHHMRGMLGSYIAAFTAFLVQNGEYFHWGNAQIILWVAPGVLGGFGIGIWSKYYREKFKV